MRKQPSLTLQNSTYSWNKLFNFPYQKKKGLQHRSGSHIKTFCAATKGGIIHNMCAYNLGCEGRQITYLNCLHNYTKVNKVPPLPFHASVLNHGLVCHNITTEPKGSNIPIKMKRFHISF